MPFQFGTARGRPKRAQRRLPAALPLLLALFGAACGSSASAADPAQPVITLLGPQQVLFDAPRDGCGPGDLPDAPLRALRQPDGTILAFGLHHANRPLVGRTIEGLRIACRIRYEGRGEADPARYNDRAWIGALARRTDGTVLALAHHEYQAHSHPGRCRFTAYLPCWWNAVLELRVPDADAPFTFRRVVAAAPFRQEVGQGRHRGFFNPSNVLEREAFGYALIATSGWNAAEGGFAQPAGACLFRTDLRRADAPWTAWDGAGFGARFPDPYGKGVAADRPCRPVGPFPAPVGGLARHAPTGLFVAIYQAEAGMPAGAGESHAVSGFYAAASPDLLRWSGPVLVRATPTLYAADCTPRIVRAYPALIDPATDRQTFDTIGDRALLAHAEIDIAGCGDAPRRRLVLEPFVLAFTR